MTGPLLCPFLLATVVVDDNKQYARNPLLSEVLSHSLPFCRGTTGFLILQWLTEREVG